jgi:hypothetical protein
VYASFSRHAITSTKKILADRRNKNVDVGTDNRHLDNNNPTLLLFFIFELLPY